MSPTIVMREGEVEVVIGAPGGTKIAGAISQVLVQLLDRRMDVVEGVSATRVDYQSGVIEAEGRLPTSIVEDLTRRGYRVHRRPTNYDTYFAQVQVITLADGRARGASDPRRDGGIALRIPASGGLGVGDSNYLGPAR
jgi:gamma-glutamyltranspeptidase/glutathione hydrolase